ncbi:MAG: hypothetical protein CVU57_23545 [Deltaproteobacteria bacterium HGW-Deltaproteobacteria-15]|jgi:hypothetical protein|nr:MAG: hypothetical protein CVU57_23545 [Deltaproteobacteria bacterium HGW-Deltaproteobacteria-15]
MDPIYGLALDLLFELFLDRPAPQRVPGPPPAAIIQTVKVEAPKPIRIPDWVSHTPRHGFVGISGLCPSIEEARQQALHSAIAQIVQNLGAEYTLSHQSVLEGDARYARHELKERLAYAARWFVRAANENVRQTDVQEIKGKYVCFLLIEFPPEMADKLRKLSMGPKAGARIIEIAVDKVFVEARENNGVEIALTDFEMELTTQNRHAGFITMFFRKVPESETRNHKGVIERRVSLRSSAERFMLPLPAPDQSLKAAILGSTNQVRIILRGYDELGKAVSLPVNRF